MAVLVALALGPVARPVAAAPAVSGPRIEADAAEFSFGRVPNDRAVEHVFKIRNAGTKPLVITRVQTSCGCTAAMMETSVVDPGQTGRLRVSFNPHGQKQVVTRTVTVYSNDAVQPTLALKVTAEVVPAGDEKKAPEPSKRAHAREAKLVFSTACLKCHGPKSSGESGAHLYASACVACHGASGAGVRLGDEVIGPPLRLAGMSVKSGPGLTQTVQAGTGHPAMPGYGKAYGGPLTDAQVASLVDLILKNFAAR